MFGVVVMISERITVVEVVAVVHITAALESMRAPPTGQTLTHSINQP